MRLSTTPQFDVQGNKYIKVDNKYYKLETELYSFKYIEGDDFLVPLIDVNGVLDTKSNLLDGQYGFYRAQIDHHPKNIDQEFYLDGSVIKEITQKGFIKKSLYPLGDKEYKFESLTVSSTVDGAVNIDGDNYISLDSKFIRIYRHGDDTFYLSNDDGTGSRVRIYKNQKSNTYYVIPKGIGNKLDLVGFNSRKSHCIAKRQISSLCMNEFFESKDISKVLENKSDYGLPFASASEFLEPHRVVKGIYKDKRFDNVNYYLSKEGFLFYAKEEKSNGGMVPVYFKLYGKSEDNSINDNIIITDVSVSKDFDTMRTIISTPSEALELIFNIDSEISESHQRWQQDNAARPSFDSTLHDFELLQLYLRKNERIENVSKFFFRSGKKTITSLKYAEEFIENFKSQFVENPSDYEYKDLSMIETDPCTRCPFLSELLEQAIFKTIKRVSKAQDFINMKRDIVEEYVINEIHIIDSRAREFFINSLKNKLGRMKAIFNEHDTSNIIFMLNKNLKGDDAIFRVKDTENVGFSYSFDPLDRIYVKTDIMPQYEVVKNINPGESNLANEYVNRIFYTLCHESVHALGMHEDYFYHWSNENGDFEKVENTLARLEMFIKKDIKIKEDFLHLCKMYFLSNPVYHSYNMESLLKPATLNLLFQYDSYLRGIILINNPDTITAIVNDLNNLSKPARRPE